MINLVQKKKKKLTFTVVTDSDVLLLIMEAGYQMSVLET
jgi:hypothetical protein